MNGKLFVVATPIGNLQDITLRAIDTLKKVDLIACEDTRHSRKLLLHYNIDTELTSYHEHNEVYKSEEIVYDLKSGKNVALITDAGTPSISDPGYRLISAAVEHEIEVIPVPGPTSLVAALSASGLPTDRFTFLGFLPKTRKKIENHLEPYVYSDSTLVFFESPRRLNSSLSDIKCILGNRKAVVCRELTKIHEEFIRGHLADICEILGKKEEIKGECIILIEGYREDRENSTEVSLDSMRMELKRMKELGLSLKDGVKVVSDQSGLKKNTVYEMALSIWDN